MQQEAIQKSIKQSVLCWLATVDSSGIPNVSPKEMFIADGDHHLLIANIASPGSVENIRSNENVCVSFIDIFKQKGFKLKGKATIIEEQHSIYPQKLKILRQLGGEEFPIKNIIDVTIVETTPIIAPSYWLFPDTSEHSQMMKSMDSYGVNPRIK